MGWVRRGRRKNYTEASKEALNNLKVRDEESKIKLKTCF